MTSRLSKHAHRPILLAWGIALLAITGITCDSSSRSPPSVESPSVDAPPSAPSAGTASNPVAAAPAATATADRVDQLLWESPTSGRPLNLAYLPPGVQAVAAWRPAQTLSSPDGKASFESLEIFSQKVTEQLDLRLGFPLSEVDQLLIGLLDGEFTDQGLGPPRVALVAICRQPVDASALLPKWNSPQQRELSGQTYYEGTENAWYLPSDAGGRCLVVTPRAEMPDVLELAGTPPRLRGELESLLADSDADRLLTVVLVPSFLSTGGKQFLAGALAPLREPLDWLLSDQALAVLVSAHLADDLFFEARLYTKPDVRSAQLERDLRLRLVKSSTRLSDYLASGSSTPYGREVLSRFPQMWERLLAHTRSDHQDRQVILRIYLPSVAAQNLALATNLALTEIVPAGATVAATGQSPESLTIEQRLVRLISLSFPRQTLEQAIELFGRETGIRVEILGGDLQLEGITKNQSFGLDAANLPAEEVLQSILRLASPDGKLIYVIKADPPSGTPTLYITTLSAAAKRSDAIPAGVPEKKRTD